jgi:ABC-type nitrate/sulfonate/bicarbonate transport system permease component
MKKKIVPIIQTIISIVLLLVIWDIASHTGIFGRVSVKSSEFLLPPPNKVFQSMYEMTKSGYLPQNIWISMQRVIIGFVIAVVIGLPVGIGMGMSKTINTFLNPYLKLFSPIPGVAWVPLAILWFGLGSNAAIFIITVGSMSPIIINTLQGINDVDKKLLQALKTMDASNLQIIRWCIIPSIIPYIVSGFKLGLGFAWRVVIAAELVGVPGGLGYVLNVGRNTGNTEVTIVTIICLGVIMIVMEQLFFAPIEKVTRFWRTQIYVK